MCQTIQAVSSMHALGVLHGECDPAAVSCSLRCDSSCWHALGGISMCGRPAV